jgi:phosphoserine phosphatase RsbU/P
MPDGRLALVMGDVVGHGLGPALFASETRAYLRALLADHVRSRADPGRDEPVLLYEDTEGERFVTLFFGILDPLSRSLCFSGAGHRAFLLQADGCVTRIDSHQPPLGLSPDFIRNTQRELTLRPGDLFFLMTDGITESACPEKRSTAAGTDVRRGAGPGVLAEQSLQTGRCPGIRAVSARSSVHRTVDS